jgi:hypothetical protein
MTGYAIRAEAAWVLEEDMLITTWSDASKIEISQRARTARLQLECVERSLMPPTGRTRAWVKRRLCCLYSGIVGEGVPLASAVMVEIRH